MANPKMISVEVDEEVFDHIKNRSEPLVDTFNSTIRRVLKLDQAIQPDTKSRSRGGTGREKLISVTLQMLDDSGGRAKVSEIYAYIEKSGILQHEDYELMRKNEPRYQKKLSNIKTQLIGDGILRSDSPKGTWELVSENSSGTNVQATYFPPNFK